MNLFISGYRMIFWKQKKAIHQCEHFIIAERHDGILVENGGVIKIHVVQCKFICGKVRWGCNRVFFHYRCPGYSKDTGTEQVRV